MRGKKYELVCVEAFDHVMPATELVIGDKVIPVAEKTICYARGQRVDLGSAKRCKEFMRVHAGKFELA